MNINEINALCSLYSLAKPIKLPTKITGGLIHKMWKLETEFGKYAIKELNKEIMSRPNLVKNMNLS
jgi:hypothetical protein